MISRGRLQREKEQGFLKLIKNTETEMYEFNTNTDKWEQIVNDPSNNDRKPC